MRCAFADRRGFDLIAGEVRLSPCESRHPLGDPKWVEPFRGLRQSQFEKLVALLRRRGGDVLRGVRGVCRRADRVLRIATYWRTNLTLRQVVPLFEVSESAADRILDRLAPLVAISPTHRPRKDTVSIVDGALVPTRDRGISASSKNYLYSTNLQVVIDANSRLVVAVGILLPGSRNRLPGVHRVRGCPGLSRSSDHR